MSRGFVAIGLITVVSWLSASGAHAQSAPRVRVENDVGVGLTLYVRSQSNRQWKRWYLNNGWHIDLTLTSPDPFLFAARDDNNGQLAAAPIYVKAMAEQSPGTTVFLRKVFETRTREFSYWSQRYRRWIKGQRQYQVYAIILDVQRGDAVR